MSFPYRHRPASSRSELRAPEAYGLDLGLREEGARQRIGLRLVHRDLEAVLAGVAAAGDEQVAAVPGEGPAGHEYQLVHAGHQPRQRIDGLGPLQCEQRPLGQGDHLAAGADACLDMGDVAHLAGAVDDDEDVIAAIHEHQVVDDRAFFGQQQPVALLARRQPDDIDRHQRFEGLCRIRPGQPQLPHVGDVEQSCRVARVVMFGHEPGGILDRHGIAGEGHHAGAKLHMQGMQGGLLKLLFLRCGHAALSEAQGRTNHGTHHGRPLLSALPERFTRYAGLLLRWAA